MSLLYKSVKRCRLFGVKVHPKTQGKASLETEWEKVSTGVGAEECWSAAVDKSPLFNLGGFNS